MDTEITKSIYDWAVHQSGIDWHEKSLLFLAVKYVDSAVNEYIFDDGREPFWNGSLSSDAVSKIFGEAWNRLVQNGYAGGVKC